jgi:hypothetical protein
MQIAGSRTMYRFYMDMVTTIAVILILPTFVAGSSLEFPCLYKCTSILIEKHSNGSISRKGVEVQSLYVKIDRNKLSIYGKDSGKYICKDLTVERVYRDTLFINSNIRNADTKFIKMHLVKDTLMGNYNFFDGNTSDSLKVMILVSKADLNLETRLQKQCK